MVAERAERPGMTMSQYGDIGPAWIVGDDVWCRGDTGFRGEPTTSDGRLVQVNDWSTYHGSIAEVADPDVKSANATQAFNDINTWPGWLNMGDQPDNYVSRGFGRKSWSMNGMPPEWSAIMRDRYPREFADPRTCLKFIMPVKRTATFFFLGCGMMCGEMAAQTPFGHPDTPGGQLVSQPMQRQMRLLVDPGDNELPMGLKYPAAVTAHLAGRNTPGPPVALRPLNHARNRNPKPGRYSAATLHRQNRRNNTLPQINRIGSRHGCWPPCPASTLNHGSHILGESLK